MESSASRRSVGPPPILDIDPFSSFYLENPFAFQDILREAGTVVYLPRYDCYAAGRYEQVKLAFSDWNNFSSAAGTGLGHIGKGQNWRAPGPVVEVDPPEHTIVRSALNRILSPPLVRSWRTTFDTEAEGIVSQLVPSGEFDAVRELVEPFVLKVFPDALGLDSDRRHDLLAIGELTGNALGPPNERYRRSMQSVEPLLPWFNAKFERSAMRPGGFGAKIWELSDTGEITSSQAAMLIRTFLRGGLDTVISGISSLLWLLATNPDQWKLLRADPTLARVAFEEAIRLETPAQSLFRTTRACFEWGGYELQGDMKILCSLGAANRDPRKWPQADSFDLRRSTLGALALGAGVHVCLGQMIARFETEAILLSLLRHVEMLELAGVPVHRLNNTARRLERLDVRVKVS